MTSEDRPTIQPRPVSYYYGNYWILGFILGKNSKRRLFAWARFALVLSCWILLLGFLSALFGIDWSVKSKVGDYTVVGYFDDGVMVAFCLWLFAGVAVFLLCVKKFDDVMIAMARMVKYENEEEKKNEIEFIRNFTSLRSKGARKQYYCVLAFATTLVLLGNTLNPWISDAAHSWAIAPRDFPWMWFIGNFWALFYIVFVFGNLLWFICCTIRFPLFRIYKYANSKKLSIPTISDDGHGGLKDISSLAFYLMLLPSGGVIIEIQWALTFPSVDDLINGFFVLYSLLLALMYGLPIWVLRKAMKKSKEENLKFLGQFLSPAFLNIVAEAGKGATFASYCELSKKDNAVVPASEISGLTHIYQRVESVSTNPASKLMNIAAAFVSSSPIVVAKPVLPRMEVLKKFYDAVLEFWQNLI